MKIRICTLAIGLSIVGILAGCTRNPGTATGSAAIVGQVVAGSGTGKFLAAAQAGCPAFTVTLNGSPATVTVDDDCSFVINDVQPATSYVLAVELTDLGITGTVTITNVVEAELIEIEVEAGADSLTISVVRRATPEPLSDLPSLIQQNQNNVEIFLQDGTYDTDLTVEGNNFTLVGVAGENCDADGWTMLTGDIIINGNNATFRNVQFLGSVEVHGNNASFVNVCFDGELVIFGHNTDVNGGDDDGDDDNANGNDNDDDDNGNGNTNENENENTNGNDNGNGGDAQAGQTFFTANGCAGCHGADASGGVGPNIQGEYAEDILQTLTGGSHPITIDITPEEAADLAAYLATF